MRAILDEYETSQHPVVVALQCLFLNALDDDDILKDINDQEHDENMMEAVHLLNMISRIASFRALSAVPSKFTLKQLQWPCTNPPPVGARGAACFDNFCINDIRWRGAGSPSPR